LDNSEIESSNSLCEACGRMFESSILLTNLSEMSRQIYIACPFCFSKLDDDAILEEEPNESEESTSRDSSIIFGKNKENIEGDKQLTGCPHYFGYLKKRPKNTQISDACLTCQEMMQCLF